MATDAELKYLISVNDRDLKEAKKNLDTLHKAIGKDTVRASDDGSRGLDRFARSAATTHTGIGRLTKGVGLLSAGIAGAGALALVGVLKAGWGEMRDGAKATAQTNAVLKSTGGAAHVTAKGVQALASQISNYSGLDDEAVQAGENMLLTFTNIRNEAGKGNDVFNQSTRILSDMSVALGQDMSKSAIQLGKALNDPIKGVTALQRVGVTFTAAQKDTIKGLVEHGHALEAQKLILAELNKEFGGSAKAAGETLPGQLSILRNTFDNLAGNILTTFMPAITGVVGFVNDHWSTISTVITAVFNGVRVAGAAVVGFFRSNWPTIQTVALAVFRALQNAWTSYLQPALRAIGGALQFLAAEARRYWPQIQQAAQAVAAWFRQNLWPTIQAVINDLRALWQKYGADIERVARLAFNAAATIVRVTMKVIKDAIEVVLAVIRGDWSKAWDSLKNLVRDALVGIVSIVRAMLPFFLAEGKLLGRAILDGVGAGIRGAWDLVKQAAEELASHLPGWMKKVLGISSPSKVFALEVGEPISAGVAAGLLSGKIKVTDAMKTVVDAAFQRAQTTLQTNFGRFSTFAEHAFATKQGAAQTPTEKLIAGIQDKRQQDELAQAVTDAQKNLDKVRADAGATPDDVAAAQKAISDATYNQLMYGLEKQAAAERANLEQRQFVEQTNFAMRLAKLQAYLESGHATTKGAMARMTDLLADFGITAGDMGELAGKLFAAGLRASIPGVVTAAQDMTNAAKNQKVVGQAGQNAEERKKAAAAAAARAKAKASSEKGGKGGKGDPEAAGLVYGTLVDLGRSLQRQGFQVGENPAFGGVSPVHHKGSYHYLGRAIDVNWPGGGPGELSHLQPVYNALMAHGGFAELLLEDIGTQNQHLHVALQRGGIVNGSMLGDSGIAGRRREAVLPLDSHYGRTQLADALSEALSRNTGALVNIERMDVRHEDDAQLVASAVNRAWGIR